LAWRCPKLGAHSGADRITSCARISEQLGYKSLWVGDRILAPVAPSDLYPCGGSPERPYPPEFRSVLDPVVVLAAAATRETRQQPALLCSSRPVWPGEMGRYWLLTRPTARGELANHAR